MKAFAMQSKNKIGVWAHMRPPLCDCTLSKKWRQVIILSIFTSELTANDLILHGSDFSLIYVSELTKNPRAPKKHCPVIFCPCPHCSPW